MRAATHLSTFLCVSSATASAAIDAFKRVDRVLEYRVAPQPAAPVRGHETLHKRASPYLNNVTQSQHTIDVKRRAHADQAPEFVVDGTKIPDVDVCGK